MKILVNLIYEAGGYSTAYLEKASPAERRQIRQLGRASLISLLASIANWGFATTLIAPTNTPFILIAALLVVTLITTLIIFNINRTYFYYSDTCAKGEKGTLLLLFRGLITLFAATLCFLAVYDRGPIWMIVPFIFATLELYPLVLKSLIGQTIAGHREYSRLEREHMRSDLRMKEYVEQMEESKPRERYDDSSILTICPQRINFNPTKCQVQIEEDPVGCITCPNYENVRAMR